MWVFVELQGKSDLAVYVDPQRDCTWWIWWQPFELAFNADGVDTPVPVILMKQMVTKLIHERF